MFLPNAFLMLSYFSFSLSNFREKDRQLMPRKPINHFISFLTLLKNLFGIYVTANEICHLQAAFYNLLSKLKMFFKTSFVSLSSTGAEKVLCWWITEIGFLWFPIHFEGLPFLWQGWHRMPLQKYCTCSRGLPLFFIHTTIHPASSSS